MVERCSVKCCTDLIVNRKYKLCNDHNFQRLHKGQSRQQVYSERLRSRKTTVIDKSFAIDLRNQQNSKSIKVISATNHYRCSDGSLITQQQINKRYRETCNQIDLERDCVCEGCNKYGGALSHSHTISRSRCKQLGKTELIYDKHNIFIECFEAPSSTPSACHNKWEVGSLEVKKKLLNFNSKLQYIKINDPETYRRWQSSSSL